MKNLKVQNFTEQAAYTMQRRKLRRLHNRLAAMFSTVTVRETKARLQSLVLLSVLKGYCVMWRYLSLSSPTAKRKRVM